MRFVGLDLAWSPRNPSGGAVLSDEGQLVSLEGGLDSNDAVLSFVERGIPPGAPGIVAIDAPLAVPNASGSRPCDREVASVFGRYDAGPYPVNRVNLERYGGLRAEALRERLQAVGFRHDAHLAARVAKRQVMEVFPHPAAVSLFDLDRTLKYKARPGRDYPSRRRALQRLRAALTSLSDAVPPLRLPPDLPALDAQDRRGRALKQVEDLLDALVCAYSGLYAWFHGPRGYAVYGGPPAGAGLDDTGKEQGHILVPMTDTMWKRIKAPAILFLDRDGTLNRGFGDRPPNDPDEVELLPGVDTALHRCASLGWRLVIVTNQGGLAFGYLTESQAWSVHQAVLDALPVAIDATYLCPHHPLGTVARYAIDCPNRKPAPGAILQALERFGAKPRDCLFVGDQESDRQAAEAASVPFVWAARFFAGECSLPHSHDQVAGGR